MNKYLFWKKVADYAVKKVNENRGKHDITVSYIVDGCIFHSLDDAAQYTKDEKKGVTFGAVAGETYICLSDYSVGNFEV